MGRAGILYSHVAKAAAKLVADGKNPTVDNVREALGGTGSKSTIAPMLKRWKAEHTKDIVEAELGVPAELLQAIKGVYDKLQADVQQQLLTDRAAQIAARNQQLTQSRLQFEHYQEATAHQRSEERQAAEQRLTRLEQELASTQQQAAVQQATIGQQTAQVSH